MDILKFIREHAQLRAIFYHRIASYTLVLLICASAHADDTISHTFFSIPPHFQVGRPEVHTQFRNTRLLDSCWGIAFEIVPYTSKSDDACELARYFMPFGLTKLHVKEYKINVPASQTDTDPCKDVEARHFNIETDPATPRAFSSNITFSPFEQVTGIGIAWKQVLWHCVGGAPRIWFDLSFPIEFIRHSMRLDETILDTGGGAVDAIGLDHAKRVGNMREAFNQPSWRFGKIPPHCLHASGIADLSLRISWSSVFLNCCKSSSYIGIVVPTGTKINALHAKYVFTPIIGNNHHWAFIYGGEMDITLYESEKHRLVFLSTNGSSILANNFQVRSFDMFDKAWSRYMEVYNSQDQAEEALMLDSYRTGTSGINVFTKCVKVDPRYSVYLSAALKYEHECFRWQFGYQLFIRHAELITLNRWEDRIALKDVNGVGATNIARTIDKNFTDSKIASPLDFTDAIIGVGELNMDSATHPAIIENMLYGSLGYDGDHANIGIGGSYEFSRNNAVMNRWTIWAKAGILW